MPTTTVGEVDIYFESFGEESDPALLLVCGLGAQCIGFEDDLCRKFAALGLRVIRFDNRDAGLSTHLGTPFGDVAEALVAALGGGQTEATYGLSEMAGDAIGLMDSLDVSEAHIFGTSMGGMIAQTIATEHGSRVTSLTSVMSNTGEPEYGSPEPDCLAALMAGMTPAVTREERIQSDIDLQDVIGTIGGWDSHAVRRRAELFVDRSYDPDGASRQALAMLSSGSRAESLPFVEMPTVVMHGDKDRLVTMSGGVRTAELIPGAQLRILEGMAHDLPPRYWDQVVGAVGDLL